MAGLRRGIGSYPSGGVILSGFLTFDRIYVIVYPHRSIPQAVLLEMIVDKTMLFDAKAKVLITRSKFERVARQAHKEGVDPRNSGATYAKVWKRMFCLGQIK